MNAVTGVLVARISGMDPRSNADLERLLWEIRFEPPRVLALPARPLDVVRTWWRPASILFAASATLCLVLLVFAFWTTLLGLEAHD